MSELPAGFVLDQPAMPAGLPAGFVLDKPNQALDIAKGAGTGLAEGAIGMAGLPGDVGSLIGQGVDYLGNKIATPDRVQQFKDLAKGVMASNPLTAGPAAMFQNAPTSARIQSAVENNFGQLPQPETTAGKIAQTAGSFVPAMIGGPESLLTKAATRVIAPTIGTEVAGALSNDNPYARMAGALIGGVGASKALAPRGVGNALPTGEDLLNKGSGQFKAAENMNVSVTPDFATKTAADIRSALKGYDPEAQGVVFRAIDRLENLGKPTTPNISPAQRLQAEMNWEPLPAPKPAGPVSMNDVELVRKQLSALRTSPDASIRSAAKTAQEVLTGNQMGLRSAQTLAGNAADYAQTMKEAVGNYGAGKRSLIVQGKQDLADLNAGTAGVGANIDNATRQAFKQLARPMNNTNVPVARKLGFNDQEIAAINQAAQGGLLGNIARYIGKAAPTGIVSGALAAEGGHAVGGPLGAIALPAAGYVAKKIGDLSTKRQVAALDSLVRSRSPLAAQVAAQLPAVTKQLPASTTALLTAMMASSSLRQPNNQVIEYQR